MSEPITLGVIAGILSCLIFLIFHQLTISNIWFSAPFMLLISALAGFALVKSYLALFNHYGLLSWIGYNIYFISSLGILSLLSIIIFTPKYTSDEILNAGGAPPDGLITNALPLTIIMMLISALGIVYGVTKSFEAFPIVLLTSAVLFLTLGLNLSILGFVEVSTQHQYLVQKFLAMNVMLGVSFLGIFSLLRALIS
ncbi:MAG: hypothetical protein ACW99A_09715 [Candidatus Kariarchaeaceae archaeon]